MVFFMSFLSYILIIFPLFSKFTIPLFLDKTSIAKQKRMQVPIIWKEILSKKGEKT